MTTSPLYINSHKSSVAIFSGDIGCDVIEDIYQIVTLNLQIIHLIHIPTSVL